MSGIERGKNRAYETVEAKAFGTKTGALTLTSWGEVA